MAVGVCGSALLDSLWEVIVSRLVGSGVPSLWTDTCDLSRRAGVAGVPVGAA